MSVCQYLVSEVHKPVLTSPEGEAGTAEPAKAIRKRTAKKVAAPSPSVPPSTSAAASTPSQPKPPAPPPAPTPLVSQIMEMGFPRRHIEYAMQTTQSNNLERLVGWLLDHANLEVPEVNTPPAPVPTPKPSAAAPSTANKTGEKDKPATASDSSSDSSDLSENEGEDEEDGDGRYFGCGWILVILF